MNLSFGESDQRKQSESLLISLSEQMQVTKTHQNADQHCKTNRTENIYFLSHLPDLNIDLECCVTNWIMHS